MSTSQIVEQSPLDTNHRVVVGIDAESPSVGYEFGDLSPGEREIASALVRCISRWGLAKTTVEDIAREAGVSRATVYRLFPGGKSLVLNAAIHLEVLELVSQIAAETEDSSCVEECLVAMVHRAATFLGHNPALRFMREHEPAEFEKLLGFERMDGILMAGGAAMVPTLSRFLPEEQAFATATWTIRLLVSYLFEKSEYFDLEDLVDVRVLVGTFMLPGVELSDVRAANIQTADIQSTETSPSRSSENTGDDHVHS